MDEANKKQTFLRNRGLSIRGGLFLGGYIKMEGGAKESRIPISVGKLAGMVVPPLERRILTALDSEQVEGLNNGTLVEAGLPAGVRVAIISLAPCDIRSQLRLIYGLADEGVFVPIDFDIEEGRVTGLFLEDITTIAKSQLFTKLRVINELVNAGERGRGEPVSGNKVRVVIGGVQPVLVMSRRGLVIPGTPVVNASALMHKAAEAESQYRIARTMMVENWQRSKENGEVRLGVDTGEKVGVVTAKAWFPPGKLPEEPVLFEVEGGSQEAWSGLGTIRVELAREGLTDRGFDSEKVGRYQGGAWSVEMLRKLLVGSGVTGVEEGETVALRDTGFEAAQVYKVDLSGYSRMVMATDNLGIVVARVEGFFARLNQAVVELGGLVGKPTSDSGVYLFPEGIDEERLREEVAKVLSGQPELKGLLREEGFKLISGEVRSDSEGRVGLSVFRAHGQLYVDVGVPFPEER